MAKIASRAQESGRASARRRARYGIKDLEQRDGTQRQKRLMNTLAVLQAQIEILALLRGGTPRFSYERRQLTTKITYYRQRVFLTKRALNVLSQA